MSTRPRQQAPTFKVAAEAWLDQHSRYIKPRTVKSYMDGIKALAPVLGHLPLNQISIEHIRKYQDMRSYKINPRTGESISPRIVNRELQIFQMVMKEHDQWGRLAPRYRTLRTTPRRAGHSLTAEEERHLFQVAFTKKKWRLAAHCMVVMVNTTMGFGELRQLRMRDVDMTRGCVTVREGAKNQYRHRTIPLNSQARASIEFIIERLKGMGGGDQDNYILPHRPRVIRAENWRKPNPWILTEPTGAMTSAFESIRLAAGLPHFRLYDLRVQAITKLLSNPAVSLQVSKEIAGHISEAMQSLYSIQLFTNKKAALDALADPLAEPTPPATCGSEPARIIAFPEKASKRA